MAMKNQKGAFADINVTPLVDVMLVLLVIFMITAPMMFNGISLTLPKTKKVNSINLNSEKVILSVSSAGELFLGKEKYLDSEILKEVQSRFKNLKTDVLYIRAHENLKYGILAKLMSRFKKAGIEKIALVTEIETNKN